jgi:hypothetical protein
MTTTEEYISYFIRELTKIKDRLDALEEIVNYRSLKDVCFDHQLAIAGRVSDAVMAEKHRYGSLMSKGGRDKS